MMNQRSSPSKAVIFLLILAGIFALLFGGFVVFRAIQTAKAKAAVAAIVAHSYATLTAQSALATVVAQMNATLTALAPTATPTVTITPTFTPTPLPGSIIKSPVDGMLVIYIPAGEFLMGSSPVDNSPYDNERPQHKVYLDAYWIDQTLVTNAMYRSCVAAGKCTDAIHSSTLNPAYTDPQFDAYPVVYITWYQAQAYCNWVGGNLPSEAQWEKAARGTDGRIYPWGNSIPTRTLANFDNPNGGPSKVGSFPSGASPYGLLDMAGNVREWIADWYSDTYYQTSPAANPPGPASGEKKVLRGGGYNDIKTYLRSTTRLAHVPSSAGATRGFRCVRQIP